MNYVALFAGVLVLLAAGVHAVVGGRELGLIKPTERGKVLEGWVQSLAGWHWVSLDQLMAGCALVVIGATAWIPDESVVLYGLSIYFAACGVVWLVVVLLAGQQVAGRFYRLGQWMYCLLIAVLSFVAAA